MIDTFEDKFLQYCKKYGIPINTPSQMELHYDSIELDASEQEYLADKQCLVWLGTNRNGRKYDVIRNQVYIASNKNTNVIKPIKLTFEEVYHIWESYEKGESISTIWNTHIFHFDGVELKEIREVIWTLQKGKWNYILGYLEEDTYDFDFKKYLRRY